MIKIGLVTVSDRASKGEYQDMGGPAMQAWLNKVLTVPWQAVNCVVSDDKPIVEACLIELCDQEHCSLILTTGGTGPAPRDITPEVTQSVCEKILPGFGELMRQKSLQHVPTAILSRQCAGIRKNCLIINLPGKPSSISECLEAVFPAVPYCLDLIGGGYLETDASVITSFRPNSKK